MNNWRDCIAPLVDKDVHEDRLRERLARAKGESYARERDEQLAKEDKPAIKPADWIENEYFSGSMARIMYPKLKKHFIRIIERNVHTILMMGATRWGKSSLGIALEGRSKYEANCLAFPQRTYHIQDESNLLYLNMNVTDGKAYDSYFRKLSTWIKSTPYFQKEFMPNPRMFRQLQFPKNVLTKYSGAVKRAAESEDLFYFVGDEVNLYERIEKSKRSRTGQDLFDAAEEIDSEVVIRMQGTFRKADGSYPSPCKVIWLCKETYEDSFMQQKKKAAIRDGSIDRGEVYLLESSEWGMKPMRCHRCEEITDEEAHECHKCGERVRPTSYFWVKTATRSESAKVILVEKDALAETERARLLEEREAPMDERFRVAPVPMRYYDTATRSEKPGVLELFQRDMMGIPTEAISVLFKDRSHISRAIRTPGQKLPGHICGDLETVPPEVCQHPFSELETDTRDGVVLIEERLSRRMPTGEMGFNQKTGRDEPEFVWRPLVNPSAPRYIGIDTGLTGDHCGWTMAHRCGWVTKVRRDQDNEPVEEIVPAIWVDVSLRIRPPPNGQIPFSGIRGLVYKMSRLGFPIARISCDSYEFVSIQQPLEERGYDVVVVSVDTDPAGYNFLHAAYFENRMYTYPYPKKEEELGKLERIVTGHKKSGRPVEKIDHPPSGSKDLSDSEAQAVWQIELDSQGAEMRPALPSEDKEEQKGDMVRDEERETTRVAAFELGNLEKMYEMEKEDEDDYF